MIKFIINAVLIVIQPVLWIGAMLVMYGILHMHRSKTMFMCILYAAVMFFPPWAMWITAVLGFFGIIGAYINRDRSDEDEWRRSAGELIEGQHRANMFRNPE